MNIEINKQEQYSVIKTSETVFDATIAAQVEKTIATLYASEGRINYILDLLSVSQLSDEAIALFQKVQKICNNESGLLVVVNSNDEVLDEIATKSEEFIIMLNTIDEAIDAVYMNELENDFKDGHEDEFGIEESDY